MEILNGLISPGWSPGWIFIFFNQCLNEKIENKSVLNADHKPIRVEGAFERGAPGKVVLPIGKLIVAHMCVVAYASENALWGKSSVTADSAAAGGEESLRSVCRLRSRLQRDPCGHSYHSSRATAELTSRCHLRQSSAKSPPRVLKAPHNPSWGCTLETRQWISPPPLPPNLTNKGSTHNVPLTAALLFLD